MTGFYRTVATATFAYCGISLAFGVPAENLYFIMLASIYFMLASISEAVSK